MDERREQMRLYRKPFIGRLYKILDPNPSDFLRKSLLAGPISQMFNDEITKHDLKGKILEGQMPGIGDYPFSCIYLSLRRTQVQKDYIWPETDTVTSSAPCRPHPEPECSPSFRIGGRNPASAGCESTARKGDTGDGCSSPHCFHKQRFGPGIEDSHINTSTLTEFTPIDLPKTGILQ